MNRNNNLLGIILVLVGILFFLDAFNVINGVFFDGWWTLFFIIPGAYSMSKNGITVGNTVILALGVLFLLKEQNVRAEAYIVPAFLVLLGLAIIFKK